MRQVPCCAPRHPFPLIINRCANDHDIKLKLSKGAADVFQKRRPVLRRALLYVIQTLPEQGALRMEERPEAPRNYSPARVAYISHVPETIPEGSHHPNLVWVNMWRRT